MKAVDWQPVVTDHQAEHDRHAGHAPLRARGCPAWRRRRILRANLAGCAAPIVGVPLAWGTAEWAHRLPSQRMTPGSTGRFLLVLQPVVENSTAPACRASGDPRVQDRERADRRRQAKPQRQRWAHCRCCYRSGGPSPLSPFAALSGRMGNRGMTYGGAPSSGRGARWPPDGGGGRRPDRGYSRTADAYPRRLRGIVSA